MSNSTEKSIILSPAEAVKSHIEASDGGWFDAKDIIRDYDIYKRENKKAVYESLRYYKEKGLLRKHPSIDGKYRKVEGQAEEIDFAGDEGKPKNLKWVFGIEHYVNIYPKNIVIIAGEPDSGKSGLFFNFIYDNQNNHDIYYFSSEMGATELKSRLSYFPINITDWKFKAIERSGNFADVIRPNAINLIDYLELSDSFYALAGMIRDIHDVLKDGIAAIGIQKKRGAELGRGAEFGLEKPRLYMSIGGGVLKIVKAKNWVDPLTNPNGMEFKFKLIKGWDFQEQKTAGTWTDRF